MKELEELMELCVKDQLLERFEIQCNKSVFIIFHSYLDKVYGLEVRKVKRSLIRLRKVIKTWHINIWFYWFSRNV